MKAELYQEDIAMYLPYKLMVQTKVNGVMQLTGLRDEVAFLKGFTYPCDISDLKPLLRPSSDLNKIITVDGETFIPNDKVALFGDKPLIETHINHMPYMWANRLIEWHFDIHDLIGRGLAIDMNKLKAPAPPEPPEVRVIKEGHDARLRSIKAKV
jgi:hypothetical protein